MKKDIVKSVMGVIDENLPVILTVAGSVIGLATTGYAVFSGWKLKDVVKDENIETKEKVKKAAVVMLPVAAGAVVSTVCIVGAHKEHQKRYVALGALYAASKIDADKFKEKAVKIIGEDKVDEIKKEICKDDIKQSAADLKVSVSEDILIHDLTTGYVFRTNLNDFWYKVHEMNTLAETEQVPISSFYEALLKDRYLPSAVHDDIGFGTGYDVSSFRPRLDTELGPDMKPVYTIDYPYAQLR